MAAPSPGALVSSGDELCREYLAWRGCSASLRAFDEERSADRGAGLSADRLTELIFGTHVAGHDAAALCGLLDFLQSRFYSRLGEEWAADTRKLESSVLRLFVVRALQAGRRDKVLELFDREAPRLLALADDWQAWFTLPYVRNPGSDARFAVFFGRPWETALVTSYRNFLASVFAALPLPALARAGADRERVRSLEAQLDSLRAQCARLQGDLDAARGEGSGNVPDGTDAPPRATREAEGALLRGLLRPGGSGARDASPPPSARGLPSAVSPGRRGAGHGADASSELMRQKSNAFPSDAAPPLRLATCAAFAGHASAVTCARFSADGGCVASASADGTVRLWEHSHSGDGARSATLYCGGAVAALEWEPRSSKLLLLATAAGGLRAWNADSKRLVCDAAGAPGAPRVRALRTSPADASFAVAAGAGLAVWSLRAFAPQSTVPLPDEALYAAALAYNHNGRLLAAGCGDGTVRLFDVGAGAQIMSWRAHSAHAPPCSLQFGPDQTSVFSLGADGVLVEWALHAERSAVRRIDVSTFCGPAAGGLADDAADEETAVAAAAAGCGGGAGARDAVRQQAQQQRHELSLQPSGRWALLTGAGCAAAAVDLRAGGAVRALHGHAAAVTCVDWHPSAPALCLTGSADATVRTAELACDGGPQPPGDDDA